MISYLEGRVLHREGLRLELEVGGVGYLVHVPLPLAQSVSPGGRVSLWVFAHWSERDGLRLFGFASREERDMFSLLVNRVHSVGPSLALKLLSGLPAQQLVAAIEEGNAELLASVKGIGTKTARSIIFQLKGALPGPQLSPAVQEAVEVLVALGMDRKEALDAVRAAAKRLGEGAGVEELVKQAISKG